MLTSRVTLLGLLFSGATTAIAQATGTPPAWQTGAITEDGTCGPNTPDNWVCTPTWGACCGPSGICGRKEASCGEGCQQGYGNCNAPPWTGTPSPDGSCGGTSLFNCTGASFGACCSAGGRCGDTPSHCGAGCQELFGKCPPSNITTDGSCGANEKTCAGGTFGNCCSADGWCGNSTDHCGAGCQSGFGNCDAGSGHISTDGRCGANGKTCTGSGFGNCCSSGGYCGNTTDHCAAGCHESFGICSTISSDGKCGSNGKTCTGSTFGTCCSTSGSCGSTSAHCGVGCQSGFGTCAAASDNISKDGKCGTANGKTCVSSGLGGCCSLSGNCGNSAAHCGQGCQKAYASQCKTDNVSTDGKCGTTNGKTCVSSGLGGCCSASGNCGNTPSDCGQGCQKDYASQCRTDTISTDGKCGTANGKTCVGSGLGGCCSATGFCGNTPNHCGQGCQKSYASQCRTTDIPSVDGTCGPSKGGWTCNGGDFNNQCCSAGGFCGTTSAHCGTGCQAGFGRCS